jgi:hypothetical protein
MLLRQAHCDAAPDDEQLEFSTGAYRGGVRTLKFQLKKGLTPRAQPTKAKSHPSMIEAEKRPPLAWLDHAGHVRQAENFNLAKEFFGNS